MIIIDDDADTELKLAVDQIHNHLEDARCLYFALRGDIKREQQRLVEVVRDHLSAQLPRIFLCENGDSFILANDLPSKSARLVMLAMGELTQQPVTESWVMFVELPVHANKLYAIIEPKLEARRIAEEEAKRSSALEEAERKRLSILNATTDAKGEQISSRRAKRGHAELMMIEDDIFSQRLVENVLQKKYAMTALKEATHALDTYARLAPDVLFLDINLPSVSGHELLERILTIDPDAYVVMLSGNADRDNIMQAMTRGAKGFVAKPFNREKIVQYIDRCPTIHH